MCVWLCMQDWPQICPDCSKQNLRKSEKDFGVWWCHSIIQGWSGDCGGQMESVFVSLCPFVKLLWAAASDVTRVLMSWCCYDRLFSAPTMLVQLSAPATAPYIYIYFKWLLFYAEWLHSWFFSFDLIFFLIDDCLYCKSQPVGYIIDNDFKKQIIQWLFDK